MAIKVAINDGDYNTAATWSTLTQASAIGAGNMTLSTTKRYSAVFTAPNTTNANLGTAILILNVSANKNNNIVVTLQESDGSTWTDKATCTINEATLKYDNSLSTSTSVNSYVLFKWASPYVYTTTTAGRYRYSFISASPGCTIRYGASTTEVYASIIDNRDGVPASTDDVVILGDPNVGFSTVTIDGDRACGSGAQLANAASYLTALDAGFIIGHSGRIIPSSSVNNSITVNGHFVGSNGGSAVYGTSASPYATYLGKIILKGNTAAATNMIMLYNYRTDENYTFVGSPKTQVGWYSSGVGSTASPLITTTSVDWSVGDKIAITGSVYNTWEIKFIKTKNSATSYILSDTAGGAESAFANAHYTTDYIINVTHNVGIIAEDMAKPWAGNFFTYSHLGIQFKDFEFVGMGGSTSGRYNLSPNNSARYSVNMDNISIIPSDTSALYGIYSYTSVNPNSQIKNVVGYLQNSSTAAAGTIYLANTAGTYENFYLIGGYGSHSTFGGYNNLYKNVKIYNGQRRSSTGTFNYRPFGLGGNGNVYEDLDIQSSRSNAISVPGANNIVKNSNLGDIYNNTQDIDPGTVGAFTQVIFDNCTFGSTSLWSSTLDSETNSIYQCTAGSYIKFTNVSGNVNDNRCYFPEGDIFSTGAGLADTTTRTTGGFAMRFRPQTGTNVLCFTQKVPTGNIQNKTMSIGVWVKINNANYWGGTHTMPKLTINYDNGTVVYASATQTTDWQLLQVPFTPTTTYGQLTVTICGASDATTTDAYFYVQDWSILYPAGVQLDLGKQAVWAEALPIVPTIATNLSAQDVWAVPTSTLTGTGTVGKEVNDIKNETGLIPATV